MPTADSPPDWPTEVFEADLTVFAAAFHAEQFGGAPLAACAAPGRVNLIGEHIDYAGGSVLPFAIAQGVAVAIGRAAGDLDDPPLLLQVARGSPVKPTPDQLRAALRLAQEILQRLFARDRRRWPDPRDTVQWQLCVYSDLPPCAGLSSSAAFAVAVAGAAACALDMRLAPLALCQLCRDAEEAATGVQCGLMDQYAVVFGRAGHAVHLDTRALTHEYVPLELPDAVFALLDSGQPRALAASGYNQRRGELAAGHPDRLRHVATEKLRVAEACAALRAGDMPRLGALLTASHASLRDDYAVSTPQLDLLCNLLDADRLAYGARLTGAGFGGSVLALLHPAALEPGADGARPIDVTRLEYESQTGLFASLRLVEPRDGARAGRGLPGAAAMPLAQWLATRDGWCGALAEWPGSTPDGGPA